MDKETLKYVLAESTTRKRPLTTPRALELPLDSGKVVTLVGIRRSGKTYLLYETMRRLEANGIGREQIVYINFEDDRLIPIQPRELDLILRAHEELYPDAAAQKKYFFLDEVQNAPGWETFVRRVHDNENAQIFVTGSSSQLLSRELATSLRGRSISYEVFPLSFAEFLAFRGLEHEPYSRASEGRMAASLATYLETGGLPEVVLADDILRPRILKEYVDLVFYKDLIERYRVANPQMLRLLLKQCLGQPATLLNIHKLYNDFKSRGFALSKDTLYQYLAYLEESYLVFTLPIADRSIRKRAMNPKKVHAVDWALGYPFVIAPAIDAGRKLETAIFLHWRRRREDLAYLAGEKEIDLVVNGETPEALINVALSITQPPSWAREMAALEWAGRKMPGAELLLVAHEIPSRKPPPNVHIVEAWRYLLEA